MLIYLIHALTSISVKFLYLNNAFGIFCFSRVGWLYMFEGLTMHFGSVDLIDTCLNILSDFCKVDSLFSLCIAWFVYMMEDSVIEKLCLYSILVLIVLSWPCMRSFILDMLLELC